MVRSCWVLAVVIGIGRAAAQEPEYAVRKLTITPAAAPVPALRYTLLPTLRDTTPGNAALLYYRAFAPEWWASFQRDKSMAEKLNAAMHAPLPDLKATVAADVDVSRLLSSHMLREVDRAARRTYCDWELTPRLREDGISLLLPDVQSMRMFVAMLAARARLELANGQFDKADFTFQTCFQMGRHVSEASTLIQALVGAAVAAVTLEQVEEWTRTPGSPNLYWALSTLPQPFIDLRMPLQGERIFLDNLLPGYREALADPAKVPPAISGDLWQNLGGVFDKQPTLFFMTLTTKKYPAAKVYLAAHGRTAAQIEALPALSAVMLYEVATYDRLYDEILKWQGQPELVARAGLAAAERELKEEVVRSGAPGLSLAGYLMPAVLKVHFASVNTDRKINLLRTVEAIRLYAAAHGKLPEKLNDITEVPVPTDPLTGSPFDYQIDGDKAILTAPPPAGEQPYEGNSRRYEIILSPKQ